MMLAVADMMLAVADYAVVVAIIVALLIPAFLAQDRIRSIVAKCGCCGHRQRLRSSRKATFTCKRCKKTLPRRLAEPLDG